MAFAGSACCSTTSSNVRFMSSIIAKSRPPEPAPTPGTGAGCCRARRAQRLRQPAGRVDGQDADRAALLGRPQRQRGGRGRLADPAGPAADDDPRGRVGEQRVDVAGVRPRLTATPCARSCAGQLVQAAEVHAVGQPVQLVRRPLQRGDDLALALLQRDQRWAWSAASSSRAVDRGGARGQPGRAQPGDHLVAVQLPLRRRGQVGRPQRRPPEHVDDHRADRQPDRGQLRDRVHRLLHRHLLQQRHQVHGGLAGSAAAHDRVGLRCGPGPSWPARRPRR